MEARIGLRLVKERVFIVGDIGHTTVEQVCESRGFCLLLVVSMEEFCGVSEDVSL